MPLFNFQTILKNIFINLQPNVTSRVIFFNVEKALSVSGVKKFPGLIHKYLFIGAVKTSAAPAPIKAWVTQFVILCPRLAAFSPLPLSPTPQQRVDRHWTRQMAALSRAKDSI